MSKETIRADVLRSLGASQAEVNELLAYGTLHYDWNLLPALDFPWTDQPYVPIWQAYVEECERAGTIEPLVKYLVQLQFPIAEGISQDPDYRAATRRAAETEGLAAATGLRLNSPQGCRTLIHQTAAGKIPILIAGDRADFVALVQALTERNEPVAVPDSMGACMVSGYNNIHRIRRLREQWGKNHPLATDAEWIEEFGRIVGLPTLFRDQFIIVSQGPYSNTSAADLGLSEAAWRETSLSIRIEHESTHYFMRRAFSASRFQKNMHEELVADYAGIKAATGKFRADWYLRFIGLENFPAYRPGARLENYLGKPRISDGAFIVLQRLLKKAAENLEEIDAARLGPSEAPFRIAFEALALSRVSIEELASADALRLVMARLAELEAAAGNRQALATNVGSIGPALNKEES